MKIHFITFGAGNVHYHNAVQRICKQARQFNMFKNIYGFTDENSKKWSFPKGRKNDDESSLYCAIREFEEETGILLSDDELSRITFFFRTSHCVYYCLEVDNDIDFVSTPKHNHEISKVKYIRIQDLQYMSNLNYDLKVFCKNVSHRLCEGVN